MKDIILQTKRLNVVVPSEASLDNWYALQSDPDVMRYIDDGKPRNREMVKESLAKFIQHYKDHGFSFFDIYEKDSNEFIGEAGLIYLAFDTSKQDVEVGYTLHKKYWGKGYGTELAKAFIEWGFNQLRLNKIVACCTHNNIASSNIMKKAGMTYKGKHLYGGKHECQIYTINNPIAKTKTQQITLAQHNPNWHQKFTKEKQFLNEIIGEYLDGTIEHVGSTAVGKLIAKPVIDIMFGVKSLEDSKSAIKILTENGYNYFPYKSDIMHWFCKPSPDLRTHHLHLVPFKSKLWNERIKFRDLLRENNEIAKQYAELKTNLAEKYANDREAYTNGKSAFIKNILK